MSLKIGELARKTQCQAETIRYYEREGLLPKTVRSESNYRVYGQAHVARLSFVRNCRSLDMTLDEVRRLLNFMDEPDADCGEVNQLLDEHISHVSQRIAGLRKLERQLQLLRSQCRSGRIRKDCRILRELSTGLSKEGQIVIAAHPARSHRHNRTA